MESGNVRSHDVSYMTDNQRKQIFNNVIADNEHNEDKTDYSGSPSRQKVGKKKKKKKKKKKMADSVYELPAILQRQVSQEEQRPQTRELIISKSPELMQAGLVVSQGEYIEAQLPTTR